MADDGREFLLHKLFFRAVEKFPDKVAATFSGNTISSINFRNLGEAVHGLSSYFKNIFSKNEVVGVYSHQNLHLLAVLLAVLDSSAAFYPLSTLLDPQKVIENLESYSIQYVLMGSSFVEEMTKGAGTPRLVLFEAEDQELCHLLQKVQFSLLRITRSDKCVIKWDESLAYVMQTSGTTGEPKAVFVPHSCIVPNIIHLSSIFAVTFQDVVLLASPYTFDPFIVQMFLAFHNGATLLIVPDAVKLLPRVLCQKLFDRHRATILQLTPSLLYYIGQDLIREKVLSETSSLRVLAMGGESCPPLCTLKNWKHPNCKATLYNIYGITEVSSWATCCLISDSELAEQGPTCEQQYNLFSLCPLGSPLSFTKLSVHDDTGNILNGDGTGHLWIGGCDRKCMLEGESAETIPLMRDTGDVVEVKYGQMWYIGRSDNQLKRFGHRVNLDYIEKLILRATTQVESCHVVQQPTSASTQMIHLFVVPAKDVAHCVEAFKNTLRERLQVILPRAGQPDKIHVIFKLPLTSHGKVNKNELLRLLDDVDDEQSMEMPIAKVLSKMWLKFCNNKSTKSAKWKGKDDLNSRTMETLEMSPGDGSAMSFVNPRDTTFVNPKDTKFVNPRDTKFVNPSDIFVLQGGDSFAAVQLADAIERWCRQRWGTTFDLSLLVDTIVNTTFIELVSYMETKIRGVDSSTALGLGVIDESKENLESAANDDRGIPCAPTIVEESAQIPPTSQPTSMNKAEQCVCFARRGSETRLCLSCRHNPNCLLCSSPTISCNSHNPQCSAQPNISVKWKTSLDKCIDASPLVVPSCLESGAGAVFIGSHSHLFMSISLSNGEVLWQTRLGGRVESSSCLSLCGQLIVVGCYDSKIYVLERSSGCIIWTYETGDVVKSSPCLDNQSGLVWVGSHDSYLYALDLERKFCKMRVHCFEGSCFSSPSVCYEPHQVYIATLAGRFLAVDAVTGRVVWCIKLEKPIFSSCLVQGDNVYVASVDGILKCFDHGGNSLWQFLATGSIFSSPVSLRGETSGEVVVTSHDHHVYCVAPGGACIWSSQLDGPVYSTPFVTSLDVESSTAVDLAKLDSTPRCCRVIFVATTTGTLYLLDATHGRALNTFPFPGEVFSSPVVVDRQIVVGCRNDYLYCLELS